MKIIRNDDQKKVFDSTISGYLGQVTVRMPFLRRSAASVGRIMLLGRVLRNDDSGRKTLRHEHGHYLDYKQLGFFKYFLGVGLPSIINASRKPEKRKITGYYNQPWEIHADILADISRDEHTDEARALCDVYYRYLTKIKRTGWFKFLFKDIWKFINHDFSSIDPQQ